MPFEDFEREVARSLTACSAPADSIRARHLAITVNRWPHGYAHESTRLGRGLEPGPAPGDRPAAFGRITIANSDAGADAYTDAAIDQAWRAVNELTDARSGV